MKTETGNENKNTSSSVTETQIEQKSQVDDNTVAKSILPYTGIHRKVILVVVIAIINGAIMLLKKLKRMRDIN